MESIYWVLTWACHRQCSHCYDDRFRPYRGDELIAVVNEGQQAFERIVDNLPDDFTYTDPHATDAKGPHAKRRGRLILAGGELLINPVREPLFFPVLDALRQKYGNQGPRLSMQTTGDVLKEAHLEAMLDKGIWMIAIASIDDYHVGMEGDKRYRFMDEIRALMAKYGVEEVSLGPSKDPNITLPQERDYREEDGPFFVFFGAQPDLWVGELWPRGRAWQNGLAKGDYSTNFCARWSGGKHFLNIGQAGSEVAIEPDGAVYPCCMKTKTPLGNLSEEKLTDILHSLRGHPALEAINRGDPEAMGLALGWSREQFKQASHVSDPQGNAYGNLCIGCDAFFEAELGEVLAIMRQQRLSQRR